MRIVEDVRACNENFKNLVLTVGSFDGVHLGHRMILERVVQRAKDTGAVPAMMTLSPHPRFVFAPHNAPNLLTSLDKKASLAAALGIELFLVLRFDEEVAAMERQDFLQDILLGKCGAERIIIGHDFAFGKGAKGNYTYLREAATSHGFEVEEAEPLILDGERVSSTLIRELVLDGELDRVERFLGRRYSMIGEVVRGRGMGKQLGYPTANIKPYHSAVPANGIYAAEAVIDGVNHHAAVNVGIAPTLRHEDVTVEAFVLDFSGDLNGKRIEIIFHKRLRPEKKFDSLDELITAIGEDVEVVRKHFAAATV
jgi:riboflavin kinase/FMN adenylyltransferase